MQPPGGNGNGFGAAWNGWNPKLDNETSALLAKKPTGFLGDTYMFFKGDGARERAELEHWMRRVDAEKAAQLAEKKRPDMTEIGPEKVKQRLSEINKKKERKAENRRKLTKASKKLGKQAVKMARKTAKQELADKAGLADRKSRLKALNNDAKDLKRKAAEAQEEPSPKKKYGYSKAIKKAAAEAGEPKRARPAAPPRPAGPAAVKKVPEAAPRTKLPLKSSLKNYGTMARAAAPPRSSARGSSVKLYDSRVRSRLGAGGLLGGGPGDVATQAAGLAAAILSGNGDVTFYGQKIPRGKKVEYGAKAKGAVRKLPKRTGKRR